MRRIIKVAGIALLASVSTVQLGAQEQPPTPGPLRPYAVPQVQTFTLSNGLRVLLVERHSLPIVSARFIVDAGAMREPAEKNGLAVMTGAISFHLFTPLGVDPNHNGGGLFMAACGVWLAMVTILILRRKVLVQLLSDFGRAVQTRKA